MVNFNGAYAFIRHFPLLSNDWVLINKYVD